MNTSNPKIDGSSTSVQNLLSAMSRTPQRFNVVGTIQVPDWRGVNKHFQGIAPLNGAIAITGQISASADTWWCASFSESGPAPARVSSVMGTSYYDHAGGIQRLGNLLPMPLENDRNEATVAFYDVSTNTPRNLYEIHMTGSKASAAAITTYTDAQGIEQAVLLVYAYSPKQFGVYRAPAHALSTNAWTKIGETNVLDSDDQFQCFGLVTQANVGGDVVYLVGFREDEEVHLYSMNTNSVNYGYLSHVETFRGWSGSQWRYGVGLQISNSTKLRIFGCSEDPSGDRDDYSFPIYYWG
ncbi:hypothetical protein POL68_20075 [Stigmatella sp. ncwal1]|uniref:Fucose-specific lectin n=1 Tax=Stigmatella ashevillensis TaxID=2995309 RepID=A0ABT5DAT6_9BACT|nr:hypothetical protein [Stigmatella ashevillena]MDC0710785.1 hypothetical protein [Stigmatella ashevillena]